MNRRRLLAMLPLAPVAMAFSAVPALAAAPEPIDPRVTYQRNDYVFVRPPDGPNECRACGGEHEFWSHGCVPIAFNARLAKAWHGQEAPLRGDAVPDAYTMGLCEQAGQPTPHQHNDFRWID